MSKLQIFMGTLADPISEQLVNQRLYADPSRVSRWQRIADYLCYLSIQRILTEVEVNKARTRLIKEISKEVIKKANLLETPKEAVEETE